MNSEERNLFNKINRDKGKNIPLFGDHILNGVHEKITNRLQRIDPNQNQKAKNVPKIEGKADKVIHADIQLRGAVKDLVDSLTELGDKGVAQKLIGEHIIMLNNIFKMFE